MSISDEENALPVEGGAHYREIIYLVNRLSGIFLFLFQFEQMMLFLAQFSDEKTTKKRIPFTIDVLSRHK